MKIKALLFDIDGTVYSNHLMHLHTIPVAVHYFHFMKIFAAARKKLHYCSADIDRSGMSFVEYQAHMLGEMLGVSDTEALSKLDEFRSYWETIFDHVLPFKAVRETVSYFRNKGLKIALLSDFPIGRKIERLGLEGLWDVERCSEDFGAIKPDPRSFIAVAEALGAKPQESVFIGNSYAFDIEGAKAAGMKAAHLKRGKAAKNSKADLTFYHYEALKVWIDQLLATN